MTCTKNNKSERLTLCILKVYSCWHKQEVKNDPQKHFKINPKGSVEQWSNQLGNIQTHCFPQKTKQDLIWQTTKLGHSLKLQQPPADCWLFSHIPQQEGLSLHVWSGDSASSPVPGWSQVLPILSRYFVWKDKWTFDLNATQLLFWRWDTAENCPGTTLPFQWVWGQPHFQQRYEYTTPWDTGRYSSAAV